MATKQCLKKLNQDVLDYFSVNQGITEFDKSINDISRDMIDAMKKEFGACWLGKINYYDGEKPFQVEYIGQKIYNFDYCYALPCQSSELLELITNNDGRYISVVEIMDKIYSLKGLSLLWS